MTTVETARVIVLEPVRNDTDVDALPKYGTVTLVFGSAMERALAAPPIFHTDEFIVRLLDFLAKIDYNPERDAFVLTGRSTKIAVAFGAICKRYANRSIRFLMYDGARQVYEEKFI
jgi:hypothetical protein